MVKLTPKLISQEFPNEDCLSMKKLALPGRGIEKVARCAQLYESNSIIHCILT